MDGQDSPSLIPRTRRVQTKGSHKKLRKACYAGIISSGETVTLRKYKMSKTTSRIKVNDRHGDI